MAGEKPVPLKPDFSLPGLMELKRGGIWQFDAALTFVTTPNAPSGRGYKTSELEKLWRGAVAAWWCWTRLTWILRRKTR